MKFIKELVIPDSLIIICESRWLHQHATSTCYSVMMTCIIGGLAAVWWWHASLADSLQCDDDMHHCCTSFNVMMTCITVILPAVWWWHASPLHSLQYDDGMHHWWNASLMNLLQCVDNMHHYGNNIIKGLSTAFQLPTGKSWGRYLQTHLFCYGNNRPGGGSLSATLEF